VSTSTAIGPAQLQPGGPGRGERPTTTWMRGNCAGRKNHGQPGGVAAASRGRVTGTPGPVRRPRPRGLDLIWPKRLDWRGKVSSWAVSGLHRTLRRFCHATFGRSVRTSEAAGPGGQASRCRRAPSGDPAQQGGSRPWACQQGSSAPGPRPAAWADERPVSREITIVTEVQAVQAPSRQACGGSGAHQRRRPGRNGQSIRWAYPPAAQWLETQRSRPSPQRLEAEAVSAWH